MTLILRWAVLSPALKLRWRGPSEAMLDAIARNPEAPIAAIIGPQGPAGGGSGGPGNWIDGEVPGGVKDGSNANFTLAHAPVWLVLTWGGLVQTEGVDFTLNGANITLLRAGPLADDVFAASYIWE